MKNGKVLFCRENNGLLLLPGGRVEKGELPIIAAIRELNEETGANLDIISFLFSHQSYTQTHYVFSGKLTDGCKPMANSEIIGVEWVPLLNIASLNTSPAVIDIVSKVLCLESFGALT